jgi:hypothetical protein
VTSSPGVPSRRLLPGLQTVAVVLAVQAHVFAGIAIVQAAPAYRSLPVCAGLWAGSLTASLAALRRAKRAGGDLDPSAFWALGAMMVGLDLAMVALVPDALLNSEAPWAWGCGGVTVLALAPYQELRRLLALAAGHAAAAAAALGLRFGSPGVDAFSLLVVLNEALLPALLGARFFQLLAVATRLRGDAVAGRLGAQVHAAALQAVAEDSRRRLAALHAEVLPLLDRVASRSAPLRRELVEGPTSGDRS